MKTLIKTYTFNPATRQITISGYAGLTLEQFLLITNVIDNIIIYNFANPLLGGTFSSNVLTLDYDTTAMSAGDALQIFADIDQPTPITDNGGSITVDGSVTANLGTLNGAATAANQTTLIGHVDGIEAGIASLVVTGGGTETGALRVTIANNSTGVVSIDDNGSSITIDGTVALDSASLLALETTNAVQSGTWTVGINTAIPAGTNNIGDVDVASLPGTVAADITAIKTATELIDNAAGNDGTAVAAGMLRVGGTDGTNNQTLSVTTTGALNIADNGGSITVDGTFWQATQPVSIASMPTTPVTGTFWQATQPVSGTVALDSATLTALETTTVGGTVEIGATSLAALETTTVASITAALPAGDNNIGNVDIVTMPAITGTVTANAGTNLNTSALGLETTQASIKTAVESINDAVATLGTTTYTEATNKGLVIGAVRRDADTTLVGLTNEIAPLQVDANGRLKVEIFDGGESHTVDGTVELGATTLAALETISIAGTVPVSGTFWQATQPVSGTVEIGATSLAALETTNAVQSGTWNINNVSGTISLPTGAATAANQTTEITALQLLDDVVATDGLAATTKLYQVGGTDGTNAQILSTNASGHLNIADGGNSITVDGTVGISGSVPVTGTFWQATQPVSIASMPTHAVTQSGTFTVGLNTAIPAGTNNIGDVDVLSVIPGTGSTNLGKQTDSVAGATDTGVAILAIRDDVLTTLTPAYGDYTQFRVNSTGRLWTSATVDAALPTGANTIGAVNVNGTVPVSIASVPSHTVTGPLTNTELRATAVPVSGTFWQATQPVSGTVTANLSATDNAVLNAIEADATAIQTAVQLLDDTVLAASTKPAVTDKALHTALGPNSVAYDPADDMMKVKSMQKKFREGFPGAAVDTTKWDVSLGTGQTATVASGALTFASGTTAASTGHLLSKEVFTVPFRLSYQLTLSQRIINQTFYVEAISVNPTTLVPNGLHAIGFVYDGTTVTQAKYYVKNSGSTDVISAASTFTTTAGTGVYEIEPFADEAWFHSGILDSSAGRANSYRRHTSIPDPNAVYKIRLRWLNGGTAPATSTNAVMAFIACQDYAELTAEITAGRGISVAGQALGVTVTNTVPVAVHGVYNQPVFSGTTYQPTNATTTAYAASLIVKAAAGALYSITGYNSRTSTQFIQIHDSATLPANGAVPRVIFSVPAQSNFSFDLNPYGRYFATGIVICNSSTGPTTTIGAADCWFDAQYR